jgi:hypothetical protein
MSSSGGAPAANAFVSSTKELMSAAGVALGFQPTIASKNA